MEHPADTLKRLAEKSAQRSADREAERSAAQWSEHQENKSMGAARQRQQRQPTGAELLAQAPGETPGGHKTATRFTEVHQIDDDLAAWSAEKKKLSAEEKRSSRSSGSGKSSSSSSSKKRSSGSSSSSKGWKAALPSGLPPSVLGGVEVNPSHTLALATLTLAPNPNP